MKKTIVILLFSILSTVIYAQTKQNIRGIVRDNASGQPLEFATVSIINSNPPIGVSTDLSGEFIISDVMTGRHDIQITFVGYEPVIVKEVLLTSSKEAYLEVGMKENITQLGEIVIAPKINKSQSINNMAIASARMLSVEEANRYAGGFDDPARLASSFAGVSSSIGNNGIVVRGNAPKFLQWRLEDVEIPNPNHFAEVTTFGGGGLTALSNQVLGNSDFFTGAFPAEYNNALSGVFDINLRNGNNQKRENTLQVGLIGIDVASEGPFKKGASSSYIFNYRYSTLALLSPLMPDDADGTRYQDLSFKMNFPTRKAGVFSLWGIGLIDRSGQDAEKNPNDWVFMQDKEDQDVKQYMGAIGMNHKINAGNNAFLKTTLAATVSGLDMHTERMNDRVEPVSYNVIKNTNWNFVLSSSYNRKFSARHTNKTGLRVTGLKYDMLLKDADKRPSLATIADESGFGSVLAAHSSSSFAVSDRWTINAGISSQFFTLNSNYSVEPHLAVKWQLAPEHSLGLAYGLHSRLELLNFYFTRNTNNELINKDLDFTRSHHLVISYDWNIGSDFHLRVEPYVQQLYDVPIIADSTYSFINLQGDWFVSDKLVNEGKGFNYGLDITFEKYMSRGYYFMITGSVFDSRYKAGDNKWHNTRYNRRFASNFLIGKEWMVGRRKQNMFNANIRLSYQGGDRYSPINNKQSIAEQDAVYDESNPFSEQLPASFVSHFTISYKINRKNISHGFAVKVLNATGYKDFYGHRYNFKNKEVEEEREAIIIPNVSYKLEF